MDSSTAKNTLYSIFDFLKRDNITLNEVINYGTQFNSSNILPGNLDLINEEWNDDEYEQDHESMKLLPEKYKDHICVRSTGDGNCFFNSAFLIIFGNEACDNGNKVIGDQGFKKENEYIAELRLMCKPHSWNSMIAFFGLASVLHRPVESLFPTTNSELMNQTYNRTILPRQNINSLSQCIIMWTSYSAKQFQISYQANHFLPVFKKRSSP